MHISENKLEDDKYVFVVAKSMVGCFIGLFVKAKLLSRIRDLKSTKIKTGLGGSAGNKGAVILRFKLDDTPIMLLNCHLMSGKGKGNKRTDELNFIFETAFKAESKNRKLCMENHQVVFLFGDLNYRINLPREVVQTSVTNKKYDALKENDELI
jgi:synaptojanin